MYRVETRSASDLLDIWTRDNQDIEFGSLTVDEAIAHYLNEYSSATETLVSFAFVSLPGSERKSGFDAVSFVWRGVPSPEHAAARAR